MLNADLAPRTPAAGCSCWLHRRGFLRSISCGFGWLAFSGLFGRAAAVAGPVALAGPLAPKTPPLPARAKRVIFMNFSGGMSHVETFDPKPKLIAAAQP